MPPLEPLSATSLIWLAPYVNFVGAVADNPQEGAVYAVEFSHRVGRELLEVAKKRTNVVPIIEVRNIRFWSANYDLGRQKAPKI